MKNLNKEIKNLLMMVKSADNQQKEDVEFEASMRFVEEFFKKKKRKK